MYHQGLSTTFERDVLSWVRVAERKVSVWPFYKESLTAGYEWPLLTRAIYLSLDAMAVKRIAYF